VTIPGQPDRLTTQRRWAARWRGRRVPAVVAALLTTSLAVSACGSSRTSPTSARILNTQKVERAIARSALSQRRVHASVSCPSGVYQKQGITFSCIATVGQSRTQFVVTQLDGSGDVHYVAR
jgi:hypothetical protein